MSSVSADTITASTIASSPVPANRSSVERWTLIAAVLASGMAAIDGSALNFVQLSLQRDFNAIFSSVAWVINSYTLVLAALILVGGAFADLYGRKRVFMLGIVIFAVASVVCGLAPSIEFLIVARLVQGVGGALMVPGSLANISAVFAPERRASAIGIWSTFSTLMIIAGPVIGGQFQALNFWRGIFFINAPIAAVALYLLSRAPETKAEGAKRPDIPGAILATVGLAGLTFGLTEAGNPPGFANPLVLITVIGGIIALIAFFIVEARSDHPMIPLSLFRSRVFSGTNLVTFLIFAGLGVLPVFMPLNLIAVQGYPPQLASFVPLPMILSLATLSRLAGHITARFGYRLPLIVGPTIVAVGYFLYGVPGVTNGPSDYFTSYFPAILSLGIGMGITIAPLTATVFASAPKQASGTASGVNNAIQRTSNVLAVAAATALSIGLFTTGLNTLSAQYGLNPEQSAALLTEAPRLADAAVPTNVPLDLNESLLHDIHAQFLVSFRATMWSMSALALLAAAVSFVMVRGASVERPHPHIQDTIRHAPIGE